MSGVDNQYVIESGEAGVIMWRGRACGGARPARSGKAGAGTGRVPWGVAEGYSLLEVLAALTVFSIVTLGIAPMLIFSIEGAGSSRGSNVAKNIAVEVMERARGLPYHVAYNAQPSRVDLLDLYFPMDAAGDVYVTSCDATTTANPACPKLVPGGVKLRFSASFVEPDTGTTPETYSTVAVPTSYRWDSTIGADAPPSQLLQIALRSEWTYRGRTRNVSMTTLFGNRRYNVVGPPADPTASPTPENNIKVRAIANQEYTLQVTTGYQDSRGNVSQLRATSGRTNSHVEIGVATVARQLTRSAEFRLTEEPTATRDYAIDLASMDGATYSDEAPPDDSDAWAVRSTQLKHPGVGSTIAFMGETYAGGFVYAQNALPAVYGLFEGDISNKTAQEVWVDNQADGASPLRLDPNRPMVSVFERDPKFTGDDDLWGGSQSNITATTASDRHAQAVARAEIWRVDILPTTFAPAGVVQIENLFGRVECTATANSGTAIAKAEWTATLRYWSDSKNDGTVSGSYQSVSLSGTRSSDPLAAIKTNNPLVYDGTTASADVYLFSDPSQGRLGYLGAWSSLTPVPSSIDAAGRVTTAGIATAIRIETEPTNPAISESKINVSAANLTCLAEDLR